MATHSGLLACKIPWTEEPGGLQPIASQRVGHDCMTKLPGLKEYCYLPTVPPQWVCEHWRFSAFTAWHGTVRQHSTFLEIVGETLGLGALSSPGCWAHMNRDHTALEVSSLSLLLIFHCTGKPHFIVLCKFCFFFFFFNKLKVCGLRRARLPVPRSQQHYV